MEVSCQQFAPTALTPEKHPGTHGIRAWVGPRADSEIFGEDKSLQLLLGFSPLNSPACSLVSTLSRLALLLFY
jgi:hypothetical protein